MDSFSILDHFAGGAVLLTGASGYVGGLVLEKLLRCTKVDKVYVLLRQKKKDEEIQGRLDKMVNTSPLMHLLRGNEVLSKVRAVAGDMKASGLGICNEDLVRLRAEVHTVIHCAADIRLEVGIQDLLITNYEGTRQLLDIANTFANLQAFVHVSSAYTNMNATPGSLVHESIYPLSYGDQPVEDSELVQELLSMPAHNANLRAEGLLAQWNFPNNYTLSKHLAEYMVADYQQYTQMPIAIVRPTLISSVARDPYPGYTGNYAGHVGATLAFMVGLFDSPDASNYKASNCWDVIPADVTANVILAAAAALGQGVASRCCMSPTRIYPQQQEASGRAAYASHCGASFEHSGPVPALGGHGGLLIVHCGSSTTYPLTIMESWNWGVEVYGAWPMGPNLVWGKCAGPMMASHQPDPKKAARHMNVTAWKIWAAAKLLGLFKMGPVARKLKIGFESFKVINQPKTDVNIRFSTHNMQRLAALLDPAEQDTFLLLWKPHTANRRRFSSTMGGGSAEVAAASDLMPSSGAGKLFDRPAILSPLSAVSEFVIKAGGGGSEAGSNSNSNNISNSHSSARSSLDIPTTAASAGSDSCDSVSVDAAMPVVLPAHNHHDIHHNHSQQQHHGAQLSPEAEEAVRKMREIPVEWRTFHINLGAYLYCSMFKMPLPPNVMPISKPEVVQWLNIKPEDQTIRHQFVLYK